MKLADALQTQLREAGGAAPEVDVGAITKTIQRALASAGLDASTGPAGGVMDTIRQALTAAGLTGSSGTSHRAGVRRDIVVHEVGDEAPAHEVGEHLLVDGERVSLNREARSIRSRPRTKPAWPGQFLSGSFTNEAGTRAYKLYVPASYKVRATGLVVMLHGCTQSPDDFAAGTHMNDLAEHHGFLVLYPAQPTRANKSECWNWFEAKNQGRDQGEPAVIAGMTREITASYGVDERHIFVAGLSAGAAMAVILGATYPELFGAVGAHSGLPYGAAHDLPSAFAAMKGDGTLGGMPNGAGTRARRKVEALRPVPTIVFHGDQDSTVDIGNGTAIVEYAANRAGRSGEPALRIETQRGATGGRGYSRTIYSDGAGLPVVEQWVVHGAGHAWSGGSPSGSFTDPRGPDASAEMIRFFYAQLSPAGA